MIINGSQIKKSYQTDNIVQDVLKAVDLKMDKGQIGVILGPSGSGKTTLMNIIGGVDRADEGSIMVDGENIAVYTDNQLTEYRRNKVGFIFQYYNLVPNLSVRENVEVVSNISQAPLKIDDVLQAVGLSEKAKRFPRELSGGEQQRVSIARAIVKNPKLILCDEPTGALDFETAKDVLSLLQTINKKYESTILMITHNSAIAKMAHRIFKLRSGEIQETYENSEPLSAERIEW